MAKLFCHRRLLDFQILFAFSNSQRLRIFLIKTIAMISAKITTARIITCDIVVVMGTPPVYARFNRNHQNHAACLTVKSPHGIFQSKNYSYCLFF